MAESAMREVIGRSQIQPILTGARQTIEGGVQDLMQKTLDHYAAGAIAIRPSVEVRSRLEIEAGKRDIRVSELCCTLVSVAAKDGIVGAVLDD